MRTRLLIPLLGVFFILGSLGIVSAQQLQQQQETPSVSDRELETFSDTFTEIQDIQKDLNNEIDKLVDKSEFSNDRFNQLFSAYVNNNKEQLDQLSDNEQQALSKLIEEINSLQQEQQQTMIETVQDNGLTVEEFNNIVAAIQHDPELQQRFQEIHQN